MEADRGRGRVTIDGDGDREILGRDRGLAAPLERVLNRVSGLAITERVGDGQHERTGATKAK